MGHGLKKKKMVQVSDLHHQEFDHIDELTIHASRFTTVLRKNLFLAGFAAAQQIKG